MYPNLSRMAQDYLSIPGEWIGTIEWIENYNFAATSTAVERLFSQGRQLLHFTRNRLSPSAIRAQLCLGSWGRHDMVRLEDVLDAVVPKKQKRSLSDVESSAA
jgi:hypothetical protein